MFDAPTALMQPGQEVVRVRAISLTITHCTIVERGLVYLACWHYTYLHTDLGTLELRLCVSVCLN